MPLSDGSVASIQDYLDGGKVIVAEEEEAESGPSDSTLIARSLASKMRGGKGAEEEEEPMTTAAVRELRRLQKERVYTHALIRVHFPDRVCVQGYFHVRHSLRDVYEWVYSILNLDHVKMDGKKLGKAGKEDGEDYFQVFELYTSPPRCSLQPYSKSSVENEGSPSSSGVASSTDEAKYLTLIEAHLVPAALIYLSWGPAHPNFIDRSSKVSASTSSQSSGSCSAVAEDKPSLGRYLSHSLLSTAYSKLGSESSTAPISYPTGESLVAPSGSGPSNATNGVTNTPSSAANIKLDGSEGPTGAKESKPKWLKLGKH
jgi:UBX domain